MGVLLALPLAIASPIAFAISFSSGVSSMPEALLNEALAAMSSSLAPLAGSTAAGETAIVDMSDSPSSAINAANAS